MYDGSLDWRQTKHNYTYQTYHNPPLTLLAHWCTVENRGVLSTVSDSLIQVINNQSWLGESKTSITISREIYISTLCYLSKD